MRVQGVDPVIINRIQEKLKQKIVQETEQVFIATDQQKQQGKNRQQDGRSRLAATVEELNNASEEYKTGLLFVADEKLHSLVLAVDKNTGTVISRVSPAKAWILLNEHKATIGTMVDVYL